MLDVVDVVDVVATGVGVVAQEGAVEAGEDSAPGLREARWQRMATMPVSVESQQRISGPTGCPAACWVHCAIVISLINLQVPLQFAVVEDVARGVAVVAVAVAVVVVVAATTATALLAGSLTGMMAPAGGEFLDCCCCWRRRAVSTLSQRAFPVSQTHTQSEQKLVCCCFCPVYVCAAMRMRSAAVAAAATGAQQTAGAGGAEQHQQQHDYRSLQGQFSHILVLQHQGCECTEGATRPEALVACSFTT